MHGYSCYYHTIKLQTSAWLACNFFVNNYFLVRPIGCTKSVSFSNGPDALFKERSSSTRNGIFWPTFMNLIDSGISNLILEA